MKTRSCSPKRTSWRGATCSWRVACRCWGIAALAITTALGRAAASDDRALHALVLGLVSAVGVLGFVAAYGAYVVLQRDLAALAKAASPPDAFGTATDSVGMF